MNFIVDAQLPKSLSELLQQLGYDSLHTLDLPDQNRTTDNTISQISVSEHRVVITKDADFLESHLISGIPPKLIIVKTGNIRNDKLFELFKDQISRMCSLLEECSLLELTNIELIAHQ